MSSFALALACAWTFAVVASAQARKRPVWWAMWVAWGALPDAVLFVHTARCIGFPRQWIGNEMRRLAEAA